MKKILISLAIIGVVGAIGIGATVAYFSDTETSVGNTFTAGTLVFNIQDPSAAGHQVFNVPMMKPGDIVTKYIAVTNDGKMDQKWKAWITPTDEGLAGALKIKWTIYPSTYNYTALRTAGYTTVGPADSIVMPWTPITELYGAANGHMEWTSLTATPFTPNSVAVYKVEVKMETSDNLFQGKSFVGNLDFKATQWEAGDGIW
jgi:predicted ribosomally synthesized peptide with SipW-like signal peptide